MAKVQVIIEEVVKGAGKIDGVTKDLKDLDKTAQKSQRNTKSASTAFTEFNSALSLVKIGLQAGQQAWRATVDEMVIYGDQVKKLQTITGQSSEAVSNQIQLADDARVSYEALTAAMRVASKNGIDTSIEGLGNLADEYKKLNPGVERTQFLMKKFGRGGLEMAKILEMDSKAIKNFKANAGQILSEEDMRNIKEYNHSLDGMKDRFVSLKGETSKKLVPLGIFATDTISLYIDAIALMKDEHLSFYDAMTKAAAGIITEKAAFMAAADGAGEFGSEVQRLVGSIEELEDPMEEAGAQAKRMSSAFEGLLSTMFSIHDENKKYSEDLNSLNEKEAELEDKKAEALGKYLETKADITKKVSRYNEDEGLSEQALSDKRVKLQQKLNEVKKEMGEPDNQKASKQESLLNRQKSILEQINNLGSGNAKDAIQDTRMQTDTQEKLNEALADYMKTLEDIDKDLSGIGEDRDKLSKDLSEQSKKREYDLVQQRLAADGLVSSDEYKYLQGVAVAMGLVTQADADRAIVESNNADIRVANFLKIQNPMATDLQIMQEMSKFSGTIVDFGVNYHSNTPPRPNYSYPNANPYASNVTASGSANYVQQLGGGSRDSGGSGIAGTPYMIGTGAQPEMFVPSTNGTFVPNANKMGATYNIVINNPKKETAENSIRSALKKLSFTGVAA